MKLIMAVSVDGFVAMSDHDPMNWTGRLDKKLFRAITMTGPRVLAAGATTFDQMPNLPDRRLIRIRKGGLHVCKPFSSVVDVTEETEKNACECMTLVEFERAHPDGWLIGGQKCAVSALNHKLVSEMHLCVVLGQMLHRGVREQLRTTAHGNGLRMDGITDVAGGSHHETVRIEHWRRG